MKQGTIRQRIGRVVRRGIGVLPPPRDDAARRAVIALRDLLTGRGREGVGRQPRSALVAPVGGAPVGVGQAGVGQAGVVSDWRTPVGITGTGRRVRSLYGTGRGATRYDADLLEALNQEYADRPLVPSPPSYAPEALAESARRRVGWVDGMVGLAGRRTLEIGCGNGFEVWSLAHNLGCDAHGVDVAEYQPWAQLAGPVSTPASPLLTGPGPGPGPGLATGLATGQVSAVDAPAAAVTFECADLAVHNPYQAGSFDRVLSFTVWEHITHPAAMLRATWDVLKPGGLAWIRANLHAGPQASHRYRDIYFPWPHLLFTDEVVREWDLRNGRAPIGLTWVNRLSWLHYEYYAELAGFEIAHRSFTETPVDEEFYGRFEDVLGRYPKADLRRDYILLVLRKPDGAVGRPDVPRPRISPAG